MAERENTAPQGGVWADLVGQNSAVATLRGAAESAHASGSGMTHAWLVTGPPGSGRSNIALAFAAALLCPRGGCGECDKCALVAARTHPDLTVLATERVTISIDEVRQLVTSSQYSPSIAKFRVVVIEDADRMTERTSNVLLKALEEPPERTVWVLCTPSEADMLPTIRSRVRTVRLQIPPVAAVADLLERRHGVPRDVAELAAAEAQSHIGMAVRLATSEGARERRAESISLALGVTSVSAAVKAAARLHEIASEDAKALTEQRDAKEREQALRSLGIEPGGTIPPQLRGVLRDLEADQKRRATRSLRDGIDRILVDLQSVYRDVLITQLDAGHALVNEVNRAEVEAMARSTHPAHTLAKLDAVRTARTRIISNVSPVLALEAMLSQTVVIADDQARRAQGVHA